MKTLVLVRHSKAASMATSDEERPLTEKGQAMAKNLASQLKAEGLKVDLMLVSPAKRARETGQYLAKATKPSSIAINKTIYAPRNGVGSIIDMLHDVDEEYTSVMVVGHEPTLSMVGYALSADRSNPLTQDIAFGMSTATAIIMSYDGAWCDLNEQMATIKALPHGVVEK
nr:phosphohistidine phosphatase SixA [Actinomyces vulturis]